jgi:hypothetical protein
MRSIRFIQKIACCGTMLLLVACASNREQPKYAAECDISSLKSADYPHDTWCHIKYSALRCSTKEDKCLTQCERQGGARQIGGGCAHVCSQDGGGIWPPEAIACANEDAP